MQTGFARTSRHQHHRHFLVIFNSLHSIGRSCAWRFHKSDQPNRSSSFSSHDLADGLFKTDMQGMYDFIEKRIKVTASSRLCSEIQKVLFEQEMNLKTVSLENCKNSRVNKRSLNKNPARHFAVMVTEGQCSPWPRNVTWSDTVASASSCYIRRSNKLDGFEQGRSAEGGRREETSCQQRFLNIVSVNSNDPERLPIGRSPMFDARPPLYGNEGHQQNHVGSDHLRREN